MTTRRRLVIHGDVQGVFFRDSTRREAVRAGVAGWARNDPGGTVTVVLEGDDDAVAAVEAHCGRGPSGARVERVEAVDESPEGLAGFAVR
jgi:acylphosphatase